jgi:Uma2 family endonuclease
MEAMEKQRLSLAEYYAFTERGENAARIFELYDGELVEKMPSFGASRIAGAIIYYIFAYLLKNPIGSVTSPDGSYILAEGIIFMPDVGYIANSRVPQDTTRAVPVAPDLAVEVKSPTDRKRDMRAKAETYLRYGTSIVWLVFPEDQKVEVYTTDGDVEEFGAADVLNGGAILPNFTLAVKDMFPK